MDDEALKTLVASAEIGEEARAFLQSDLYKTIIGLANQETDARIEDLMNADPSDEKTIAKLQMQAKFADFFVEWLNELVSDADNALEIWRHNKEAA